MVIVMVMVVMVSYTTNDDKYEGDGYCPLSTHFGHRQSALLGLKASSRAST